MHRGIGKRETRAARRLISCASGFLPDYSSAQIHDFIADITYLRQWEREDILSQCDLQHTYVSEVIILHSMYSTADLS